MPSTALIPSERLGRTILVIRGQRVILDSELAGLYAPEEVAISRSQSVISSGAHGGRRGAPFAFTEQGVAMLSSRAERPRPARKCP